MRNWANLAGAACAALILSACGQEASVEGPAPDGATLEARPADAPRAPAEVSTAFEYLRFAVDTEAATPELCLVFSGALDPAIDYSPYVAIDEPVSVSVSGSQLCLGGLTYGQVRSVTLREGLPAADGRTLERDVETELSFDDRPAYVGFSGNGVILPRIDADGLAIETVNVDEVEITVRRVNDRALVFRQIGEGFTAARGEWYWTGGEESPGELGVTVFEGRVGTEGEANARQVTVLPVAEMIGTLEPGAYYVAIADAAARDRNDRQEPARAARWLIVTDLAFTAYRGETGLEVVVRSLDTAEPASDVEVQLVSRANEVLATSRSARDGRVTFDAPLMAGREGDAPRLITGYGPQGDFAVLDLNRSPVDLSDEPITGRRPPGVAEAYVYLDRGIYRPGETVQAGALLRGPAGNAVEDRAGALVVYQPNGLEQARYRFNGAPDAGGLVHAFALPRAAARGGWRIAAELDGLGAVGSVSFQVEDFVPQRVALELEADTESPIGFGETRFIDADVRFLYGAPGAGLPLEGEARLQRDPRPFPEWAGYRFGLHDERFAEEIVTLPPATADGAGRAQLPISLGRRGVEASVPLRVRAVVRVQEPGGRAVADDVRIPYRPRPVYAGLRAAFEGRVRRNQEASFEVIGVDALGEARDAAFEWRLVRRDFEYDWYRTGGGEWRWRRSERIAPITDGVVRAENGQPGQIATPALDWGSYRLIVSRNGEDVASRAFWVGWGGRTSTGDPAPDQVQVSAPDGALSVGAWAEVVIQAPYAGRADVVVATDRVLSVEQIDLPAEGMAVEIPVTDDWGQGAYVMVTVHTPRDPVDQPLPRRAVGVAYVPVDIDARTYEVALTAPDVVEPNQSLDIGIAAEGGPGGEVFLTLAAVDEGVLLLTGHQSPDPVAALLGKEALGVDLLDDYGRVLDPNQGAAAALRSGGDQIGGAGLSVVPTRTVALFSGAVALDRSGRGTVTLDLPDFNGELRLMAVAWSQTGLGSGARPLTVRDAVPAELILPRFLAPGDRTRATATLDNIEGPEGEYAVAVTTTGPVSVEGGAVSLGLSRGEREDALVLLSASDEGIADLQLDVSGPDGFAAASAYPIEVRSPFLPETRLERTVLRAGQSYTPDPALLAGYAPGSASLRVSASASPIDAAPLYESLYRYPYACTEQLVSRVMPLLYAENLAALANAETPDGAQGEIQSAIETLLSRQSADGAFGLWRIGDRDARPWIGGYAVDFLYRAHEAGHPVPDAALSRALAAMQPISQGELWRASGYDDRSPDPRWSEDSMQRIEDRSAAYALYVLARAGEVDRSRLRYMHDERLSSIESPLARAHIGAALAAIGDRARAISAFDAAVAALGYQNRGDWYQTPLRDRAGVLALASEVGLDDVVEALVAPLSREVPEPRRLHTQEKAWLILAAAALSGGADAVPVSYDGAAVDPASVMFDPASLSEAGSFTNTGPRPIFLSMLSRGAPSSPPPAVEAELVVEKRILAMDGLPADLGAVRQGDRMIVVLSLSPQRQALASYVVADLLPAGFEIEAVLSNAETGENRPYSFVGDVAFTQVAEARDDRFVAALNASNWNNQTYRMAYIVRAVTPGDYALPGVVAEDMYAPTVFARSEPGRVQITP
jgi:uncharacterized protein YfaS (alpha-2-macroglobulin family)